MWRTTLAWVPRVLDRLLKDLRGTCVKVDKADIAWEEGTR